MGQVLLPLAVGGMVTATAMSYLGQKQEGKTAQKIANARAMVDLEQSKLMMQNAAIAKERAIAEAGIRAEEGRKLKARQKVLYAAGGVKINVGAPLVIEAQTSADIATDIGYVLKEGEQQASLFRRRADIYTYQAGIERAMGKAMKKQSDWAAMAGLLQGGGSLAMMGYAALPSSTSATN